jgi:hypothetical protein
MEGDAVRTLCSLVVLATMAGGLALPVSAAPAGGSVTVRVTSLSPLVALIAGILILLVPRLLNYIVAVYLIVIGLIGLMGR